MILVWKTIREHYGLLIILTLAAAVRLFLLRWWSAAPFGDVVNFIDIARSLARFTYPLADKRLPFYPFLILLGHTLLPMFSWEAIAIAIALTMSLLALVLLYAIARTLHFSRPATLAGLLLFASFFPFLAYSIRGYADTTFLALLLAVILTALHIQHCRAPLLAGFLLGCLALTRYEGLVAGIVILMCLIFSRRLSWSQAARLFLIGLLTVTPYLAIARHAGRSLLPTAYLTQAADSEQGYGAKSWGEWREQYFTILDRIGLTTWLTRPVILYREARDDLLGWHQHIINQIHRPAYAVGWIAPLGLIALLRRRQWFHVSLITLPFLAVAAPIAWWAPLIRYDAFVYPLMILLAMAGLQALLQVLRAATLQQIFAVALLFIASTVWLLSATQDTQEKLRKTRHRELADYQALVAARQLPGPVAFENYPLFTQLTLPPPRSLPATALFDPATAPDNTRWQALQTRQVTHAVVAGPLEDSVFAFLTHPSSFGHATLQQAFSVEEGDHDLNSAAIYALHYYHD